MAFCTECGAEIDESKKFCPECGTATNCKKEDSQRKQEYSGKIIKCPNCGEVLKAFISMCPSCGYELRGTNATNSVRELAFKLENIEAQREHSKNNSFKERLYGRETTKTDEQKISLIRSFAIPNTKEDLYEFLILAESNIDIDLYDGTIQKTDSRVAVSDAWKSKFEQAYQKSKLVFENDLQFQEIQKLYDKTHKKIKKSKGKQWKIVAYIWGGIIAFFAVVFLIIAIATPGVEKREVARLDGIVKEIETQLDEGQYKLALMNAQELFYNGAFKNDEQVRKWNIQKEYWIDKIITEASENGVKLEYPSEDTNADDSGTTGTQNN